MRLCVALVEKKHLQRRSQAMQRAECLLALFLIAHHPDGAQLAGTEAPPLRARDFLDEERLEVLVKAAVPK